MSNIVPMNPVVDSSAISAEGYDPATQTLAITWTSGKTHHFQNVPQDKYDAFQVAESKGSHIAKHIKPHHDAVPYVEDEKAA